MEETTVRMEETIWTRKVRITDSEVIFIDCHSLRKAKWTAERLPLAGAHAEVVVDRTGLAGRNQRSTIIVTGANGAQITYTFGGRGAYKGSASLVAAGKMRSLAAKINTAAAAAAG